MTAKQMFEELGYWLEENNYYSHGDIILYKGFHLGERKISQDIRFNSKNKIVT